MKARLGAFAILGIAALLAAVPACAEPGDGRFGRRFGDRRDVEGARADRVERLREFRRDDPPAFGRMSPEERRQLRHDIRAAREGVYRRPPPPPPPLPYADPSH
ncbi:MAG: hypothetical protein HZA64_05390 [Rhodocyclales bacterium]|nr:hypothetical protein [Rhodocyclales bacterium]